MENEFDINDFELDAVIKNFNGNNPYYSPEKCGLVKVAEAELDGESYQFHIRIVWKAADGKFYTASDSGCSCPTPFEDIRGLDDLTLLDKNLLNEIKIELRQSTALSPAEAQEFLYKIRDAII